ncbi:hypothetical protein ACWC24_05985 [Streptomyces sp. NPDC001443]
MSRETDTPSSGPDGRGGAAYPSGTPPYGTPMVSDADAAAGAGRPAARPEERKTETTLTTRIRINIPGSRPIPPVVVRTPVADTESGSGDDTGTHAQPDVAPSAAAVEPPAEPEAPAEEKTSDWFAPRKGGAAKSGSTNGAGMPGGAAAGTAPAGGSTAAGQGPATGARPGAGRPGGTGSANVPGGSRPGGTNGAGLPGATGGPVAPGHGGGTGSFDVTEALAAGPLGGGARPGTGEPRRDDLPYFTENGRSGHGGPPSGPGGQGGAQGPSGPTGGPVTGDGPLVPPAGAAPGAPAGARPPGGLGVRRVPGASGAPGGPGGAGGPARPGAPGRAGAPGRPDAPKSFTGESFTDPTPAGPRGGAAIPGGGLSDDTAILTPQKPASGPGPGGYGGPRDKVSGDTVTSGMPVAPPGAPFGPGPRFDGPPQHTGPKLPEPVAQNVPAAAPRKKKGRSKLVLLGGLAVVALVGAYGAGLLMNHSDVPKGTTVLGVDIGGGTRDEAVKKLDDAFGKRVGQPLKLSVGGTTVTLKPDQAGLQFDEQATVAAAAQSDYNPVSVIGSLFGGQREIEPAMPVDEEKLQAALESAAGGAGSNDGTIRFQSGKAVAVYGKPGKGIDVAGSKSAVQQAYRTQVETGAAGTVQVPTTTRQPTVSDAEVDRMMKKFAQPAMSGKVTVQTDAAHSIPFSPQKSLWKFLEVKAVDGKLVESYNEAALKELYGHTFDGVLITRGTGQKTAVTVQDVISALRPALISTTNRVAVIDTNPS